MVCAILEGRKPQTRRIVRPQFEYQGFDGPPKFNTTFGYFSSPSQHGVKCPYGIPSDRLWVKEALVASTNGRFSIARYAADSMYVEPRGEAWVQQYPDGTCATAWQWRRNKLPSIHMPRWASRITLQITDIRVERLMEISEEDAKAEGIYLLSGTGGGWKHAPGEQEYDTAKEAYAALWQSINGPGSWDKNPWVWVVEFERI